MARSWGGFLLFASGSLNRGDVAKWQGGGLQNLYHRFESDRRLQYVGSWTRSKAHVLCPGLVQESYSVSRVRYRLNVFWAIAVQLNCSSARLRPAFPIHSRSAGSSPTRLMAAASSLENIIGSTGSKV